MNNQFFVISSWSNNISVKTAFEGFTHYPIQMSENKSLQKCYCFCCFDQSEFKRKL